MNIYRLIEIAQQLQQQTIKHPTFATMLLKQLQDLKELPFTNIEKHQAFIAVIEQNIRNELAQSSIKRTHKQTLKILLHGIEAYEENLKNYFTKRKPSSYIKMATLYDTLYQDTEAKYNGTVMLPIKHVVDLHKGGSNGECLGYTAEAIFCFLNGQKFMGVAANAAPPFKVSSYNSSATYHYPDFNHLARINERITRFQSEGVADEYRLLEIIEKEAKRLPDAKMHGKRKIVRKIIAEKIFYKDAIEISKRLIALSGNINKSPEETTVFLLALDMYSKGHALFYTKNQSGYHFIDSNYAWFRFNTAEDFQAWFMFFLAHTKYIKSLPQYSIEIISNTSDLRKQSDIRKTRDEPFQDLKENLFYLSKGIADSASSLNTWLKQKLSKNEKIVTPQFPKPLNQRSQDDSVLLEYHKKLQLPARARDDLSLFKYKEKTLSIFAKTPNITEHKLTKNSKLKSTK